ncbi:sulfatase family protein [Pontiella sulfatireligans]|uniref:Arylsulfatase n=1 Tax=Pontiella sulfatireligans TaxID=2750658 RepID=A0A6C2UHX8_9BACT|nr:sulfatase-like hydrolase/transferase [Pontiella sulfatireligans]SPS74249.1 sulfatase S1_23 [Kiritimatiellales bacterium]VGO18826.1 Arylsulfatase [Pontiella sulfatireligans]
MNRTFFSAFIIGMVVGLGNIAFAATAPNIVFMMCDDMGWGDTGFNGNKIIKTPNLDRMAEGGAVLNHFYSVGPVCSPTRASFLTGRHYWRLGIWKANQGHLPQEEYTIARMLKAEGYTTGHFGKWHLGTLSKTMSAKGAARKPEINYAPPWDRDYDESFVAESAIRTWNPTEGKQYQNNPYFENGIVATENLKGCDSRILMDRAIPFIQTAVKEDKPFVAVVWFHAPHEEVEAGPEYLKMYEGHGEAAHYYGCITAVDDQVGRLRSELEQLGVADNTALFFCSDNGPEGSEPKDRSKTRRAGRTGGFSGRKRSLHEGGVRVPALALWPGHITPGSKIDVPMSVLDYLPTVCAMAGAGLCEQRVLDGENILPILVGGKLEHTKPIPFRHGNNACLVQGKFKLIIESSNDASKDHLFDLSKDRKESHNVLKQYPEKAQKMRAEILAFLKSAKNSHSGAEYDVAGYKPVDYWHKLGAKKSKAKKKKTNVTMQAAAKVN